mgnify:CR=1 FL=1|tara:strand:- start:307 stop:600 length:294 start_codon:yes stop_codon:yes gene_type:complete
MPKDKVKLNIPFNQQDAFALVGKYIYAPSDKEMRRRFKQLKPIFKSQFSLDTYYKVQSVTKVVEGVSIQLVILDDEGNLSTLTLASPTTLWRLQSDD